jgi:TPR repeat protein
MLRRIVIGLVFASLIALPTAAQDFQTGLVAYKAGDYASALREWRPLAAKGDARAQHNLGVMSETGRGVPQDHSKAIQWYRKAAEQGHARAQYNLGLMYAKGRGVRRDYAEAAKWYRKAAEAGVVRAQTDLGFMHYKGQGVPQNDAETVKWYRKAAEQGHADAQNNLGVMYLMGRGVPQDDAEAEAWLRKAAKQGDADAQRNLRAMREKGRGVATKEPPASAPGGFRVQVGSVKSETRAVKEAGRLNHALKSVLGNLKVAPVRADLGSRGVFYRLRTGPLDRAAANALCRKLSARKQGCIVIKR